MRFTILLGYIVLFLWLWMVANTHSKWEPRTALHYVPMWGFILSAWMLVRLERMARQDRELKKEQAKVPSGKPS